ncbi:hypothetical protein [Oceanobacillus picturae]|uniref:hypothetical protein n=1 Tax=Oceanobacillus picturae TaxID=171693 RepID=UPI000E690B4A|nr:hypothetical protein [Oceanobacillus picturae]RIU88340.1 hypothetical protein D1864_18095 [Oceanobacillus picturae]
MTYHNNLLRFLFSMDDHLIRVKEAESIKRVWKVNVLLILLSLILYGYMAYLGMGTNLLSPQAQSLSPLAYEQQKFWFFTGRLIFGLLFAVFILFIPSLYFSLLTDIPYKKLVIMQQVVLFVLLVERAIWIPLAVFNGLDWYVSPVSFGIIASYFTEIPWLIYFFGAISLFQLWIIWFQVRYIRNLTEIKKQWVWGYVLLFHFFFWLLTALLAYMDQYMINRWFGQ